MIQVGGILETALHVEDLSGSSAFSSRIFGFQKLLKDKRMVALNVADRDVLLLFLEGGSVEATPVPGGVIPPHGGSGKRHFAFSIASEDVEPWKGRLVSEGVPIESLVAWPRVGQSLSLRDPDGHFVELISPGSWSID